MGLLSSIFASNGSALSRKLSPDKIFSRRSQFLQVLDDWWSTPALPFLWVVVFEMPKLLSDANLKAWGELVAPDVWGTDDAISNLHDYYAQQQNISGCMFAQGITIPGEVNNYEYVGQQNRGFTYSPILNHRIEPALLQISLLETNNSFVDAIIRPWTILTAHYGMVARPEGSIKANFQILELAKSGDYTNELLIRKQWLFTDCVPVNVDNARYQYTPDQPFTIRETQWAYTRYQPMNMNPDSIDVTPSTQ